MTEEEIGAAAAKQEADLRAELDESRRKIGDAAFLADCARHVNATRQWKNMGAPMDWSFRGAVKARYLEDHYSADEIAAALAAAEAADPDIKPRSA